MSEHTATGEDIDLVTGIVDGFLADLRDRPVTGDREAWARQFDAGLAWVEFPRGLGGLGASRSLRGLVSVRLAAAGVRDATGANGVGVSLVAPVLLAHGTLAQQQRYLRPLFTGEELWCQLFSEPGAGSDLASLASQAVPHEGGWLVNGQKVWTTLGHTASFGLLVARTDPDVPKHAGLSMFVADMSSPGVDVRGIREITGDADFNEVFLQDVHLGADALIGEAGSGWRSILGTLANERATFADTPLERGGGAIGEVADRWARHGGDRPELRDRYLRLWVRAEGVRLAEHHAIASDAAGTPSAAWSSLKILRSELDQDLYDFCLTLMGVEALEYPSYEMHRPDTMGGMRNGSDVRRMFLFSRCATIAGGTSEIQRTIIADRVLGLPREPQTDRGTRWRELRRS